MPGSKWRKRFRWAAIVSLALFLVATVVVWRVWSARNVAQWQMLQDVVRIEAEGINKHNVQTLGAELAILGRDDEVRRMDFHPQFEFAPLDVEPLQLALNVVAWPEGLRQIAGEHRIVMIMENHVVSKHREMIGATLPLLRKAGFTHYAAEAIGESAKSLKSRRYPNVRSGFYTNDPRFGNVIRQAMNLGFEVLGYDFRPFTHEGREEYAASVLAELVKDNAESRLVVHAGHAHVLKHETEFGQRWLASLLWEKTGIEPFTIWQWSDLHDAHEYHVVAEALAELGDFEEPVLLMPPPTKASGLSNVPRVDAILVHPPDQSVAPDARTVLFPDSMQRVFGKWQTRQWPVVIAAYQHGEPINAIPLDQVMLRDQENEFVLWVPSASAYDIRVFDKGGLIDSITEQDAEAIVVRTRNDHGR